MRLVEAEFPKASCERVTKYVDLASPVHSRIAAAKATRVNAGVLVFLLAILVSAILLR
jgi:hypothetical protein